MTDAILEVRNLTKHYKDFTLSDVSFTLPKGCIMGFIGENGAGKSTTIKAVLNLIKPDSGEITLFGEDYRQNEIAHKEDIGVVFDETNFAEMITARQVNSMMRGFYKNWDSDLYLQYLERFGLPLKKTIKEYSRGMKMKLSIAVALSHKAKLLLLDEATSGLDPIVRDEILDVFLEFIQDEDHSIFFSSHITSDLEKVADYITFIHKGKIYVSERKDILLEKYAIVKCTGQDLEKIPREYIYGVRRHQFGAEAMVEKAKIPEGLTADPVRVEDIMLFTVKGENQ